MLEKEFPSVQEVKKMNYSELVGLIRERNRPSGGIRTLFEFAHKTQLSPPKKVLEVGSNTGFSVVNLALLSGCMCYGIDINQESISESVEYAKASGVSDRTEFRIGNALEIPYPDDFFDVLWVSNVTSFIDQKHDAFLEYLRVLKPGGYLGVAPIYYREVPPSDLLESVEEFVGTELDVRTLDDWKIKITSISGKIGHLIECDCSEKVYIDRASAIEGWLSEILDQDYLDHLPREVRKELVQRYSSCMRTFNENLKYCGFALLTYQKRLHKEESELFLTTDA